MSLYRDILGQAWQLTWNYKYLWFFGLFAALLGNGGELELIFRGLSGDYTQSFLPSLQAIAKTGVFSISTLGNIGNMLVSDSFTLLLVLGTILLLIFLSAFMIWLVMVSQAAIVNNAANGIAGKKHDFKGGLDIGMKKFWPILGLNVLLKLIIYILFVFLSLPAIIVFYQTDVTITKSIFIASFLVFVPLSIVVAFIIKYAVAYTVIKGSRIIQAIREGWILFVNNWLVSIEMAFILFFINFLVGLCLVFLFLILAVPFLFISFLVIKSGIIMNFGVLLLVAMFFYLVIIAVVGSALATFQISSWTGLFIKLVGRGGVSKIVRMIERNK